MISLAVISLKDIIKLLKRFFIISAIVIIIINSIRIIKIKNIFNLEKNFGNLTRNIDKTILLSNYFNNKEIIENSTTVSGIKKILVSELVIFSQEYELMEKENQEENVDYIDTTITMEDDNVNVAQDVQNEENNKNNENNENNKEGDENSLIAEIPYSLKTKVIDENNKIDKYTEIYQSVKIKNESKYELTENILTPDIDFSNKKDIIIYHTHTCESYTPTEQNNYIASGNFRTIDLNYSVSRVGSELTNYLNSFGFNVVHNNTYHDYPAYTGSYTRSLSTINSVLSNNNAELVIDLHRDALGSNSSYAPSIQIGDEIAAQLMFVIRN